MQQKQSLQKDGYYQKVKQGSQERTYIITGPNIFQPLRTLQYSNVAQILKYNHDNKRRKPENFTIGN